MANAVPDSRMPRRFTAVSSMIATTREQHLVLGDERHREPMFDIADDIDTATVST